MNNSGKIWAIIGGIGVILGIIVSGIYIYNFVVTQTSTTPQPSTATQHVQNQQPSSTPPCPTDVNTAATVLGVSILPVQVPSPACGWQVQQSVTVTVYAGLCVDISSMPETQVQGEVSGSFQWIGETNQLSRILMQSNGSVPGPATVYWGSCPTP